ncbi:MAG: site-specific DNA-methyltransferase [Weeksellaceae bacterium]|nr:site-specific DNA-methyltransferase [Weeksellaceae bacterium]
MPTLHWIGKDKVINHHLDVPFKVLEHSYGFDNGTQSEQETNSGNKIIHGDNLEALKGLLAEYEGRIKCIYIDPPYNTGNEGWVYNDNVNDPKIKKWLHSVVGKEGEDLSRHDKWCCMMYPRLKLLHKLLHENGIIIIHIDENAYSYLHLLLIEIFGNNNDLGTIIWDKKNPKGFANKISYQHESILLFSKNHLNVKEDLVRKKKNAIAILKKAEQLFSKIGKTQSPDDLTEVVKKYKLPKNILEANAVAVDLEWVNKEFRQWIKKQDFSGGETAYNIIDENGDVFQTVSMAAPDKPETRSHRPLKHPITQKDCPVPQKGWRFPDTTMDEMLKSNRIVFGLDETTQPRRKYLLKENMFESISSIIRYGGSDEKFQAEIGIKLENPKPFVFANEILSYFTKDNDIILDSFAGSGTTAHSVLNLNKEDGGNRKFILVEMMDYAEKTTSERVKRAIKGFGETEGTGGSFDFYELGQPMFLEDGNLNELVGVEKIRQYVYYTETKTPLTQTKHKDNKHFLGKHNDTAYYFHYEQDEVTTLDHAFLATMKTKAEQYVIYADNCLLTKDFMTKHNIIFKKIPRDITKF